MIKYQSKNVTVFQSLLYKTTSLVIRTEDCVIIVDPNLLPTEVYEIREYVNKIKGERPLYLLFTHSDWDHIVGYGVFQEAQVIASRTFQNRVDKEKVLKQIESFDNQYYLDRDYPLLYPNVDIEVVEDGQELQIGETKLIFYLAPGHTDDGIFTVVEPLGIWIAGDYLSDVEFPFIYDNSEKYEETLSKTNLILTSFNINLLVPGHGHPTDIKEEILFRKVVSYRYIQELRKAIQHNEDHLFLIENYLYKSEQIKEHEENYKKIKEELRSENMDIH